ncbi:MAG: hypothetical protein K5656_08065 [Lachnospiraceae bacterium]|nr:hypothetical protein [Lachnospiraceae bacterium]
MPKKPGENNENVENNNIDNNNVEDNANVENDNVENNANVENDNVEDNANVENNNVEDNANANADNNLLNADELKNKIGNAELVEKFSKMSMEDYKKQIIRTYKAQATLEDKVLFVFYANSLSPLCATRDHINDENGNPYSENDVNVYNKYKLPTYDEMEDITSIVNSMFYEDFIGNGSDADLKKGYETLHSVKAKLTLDYGRLYREELKKYEKEHPIPMDLSDEEKEKMRKEQERNVLYLTSKLDNNLSKCSQAYSTLTISISIIVIILLKPILYYLIIWAKMQGFKPSSHCYYC